MIKKKINLDDLEVAPRVHIKDEVVVEESESESRVGSNEAVSPQPVPQPEQQNNAFVGEPPIDEDDTDEEKEEELERRAEAREDAEDGINPEELVNQPNLMSVSRVNRAPEVDNEYEKFRMLVQGSDTSDGYVGGSLPFDMALTKIETAEDRALLRLEGECLIESSALFGRDSQLSSEFREYLKGDIMLSRGAQGFLTQSLITTRNESFVNKNVRQDKSERFGKGGDKTGFLGGMNNQPQPNYVQNY